jgi:hypothetical protein
LQQRLEAAPGVIALGVVYLDQQHGGDESPALSVGNEWTVQDFVNNIPAGKPRGPDLLAGLPDAQAWLDDAIGARRHSSTDHRTTAGSGTTSTSAATSPTSMRTGAREAG